MSVFDNIQIRAEAPQPAPSATGNALPLLHEIRHALRQLSDAGTATVTPTRFNPLKRSNWTFSIATSPPLNCSSQRMA